MTFDVSIIIPTYNKKTEVRLTLHSLEKQTFDLSRMEVILVDDGSTDGTLESLQGYYPAYFLQCLRSDSNTGRSASRNRGIHAASAPLLIFLDAEMIVEPDFVANHMKYQEGADNLVVTGVFTGFRGLYSILSPSFKYSQFKHCRRIVRKWPSIRKHCTTARTLKRYIKRSGRPKQLVRLAHIDSGQYKKLSFEKSFYYKKHVLAHFGPELKGFHLPWIGFLTGNISVKKALVEKAGYFDENFQGYGFEDWELGFRLFQNGARFYAGEGIVCYHQEHPFSESARKAQLTGNLLKFYEKHHDLGIALIALHQMGKINYFEINRTIQEYYHLKDRFPDSFRLFRDRFVRALHTLLIKRARGRKVTGSLLFSNKKKPKLLEKLSAERKALSRTGDYKQLAAVFGILLRL
ncbi:glycosyltransferase family 2 protein [Paenibacillus aurantius]|uniref:Glycosyltransferase family 2 protein n=1 Tax=Paenibacillus aurantius TaxID=2918900 RepID=A0AA96RH06_9BACL|nr:glycosyltransferase family 2 protein [Paenibacillus aurantius]WNQ12853.1 glycosyltransferase family 2 protein [Paenibacillus aurantius]